MVEVENLKWFAELDAAGQSWIRRDVRALTQLCEGERANDVAQGEVLERMHSYLVASRIFLRFVREHFKIPHTTVYRRIAAYRRSLEVAEEAAEAPEADAEPPRRIHVIEADRRTIIRNSFNACHKDLQKLGVRSRKPACLELVAFLLDDAGIHEETTIVPKAVPDDLLIRRGRPVKVAA